MEAWFYIATPQAALFTHRFGVSGVLEDTHGTSLYACKLEYYQVCFSKVVGSFASCECDTVELRRYFTLIG
jgi:hypothetical protein